MSALEARPVYKRYESMKTDKIFETWNSRNKKQKQLISMFPMFHMHLKITFKRVECGDVNLTIYPQKFLFFHYPNRKFMFNSRYNLVQL